MRGNSKGFPVLKIPLAGTESLRALDTRRKASIQCQLEPTTSSAPVLLLFDRRPVGKTHLLGHRTWCILLQPRAWRAVSTSEEHVDLGCGKAGFTTEPIFA